MVIPKFLWGYLKQKIWTQPHNQQPQNAIITASENRKTGSRNDSFTQWAQDVHRTSPGRLLVPVYFRRPEDVKMGPDLDFILRDVLRTSLGRPIKNFN